MYCNLDGHAASNFVDRHGRIEHGRYRIVLCRSDAARCNGGATPFVKCHRPDLSAIRGLSSDLFVPGFWHFYYCASQHDCAVSW